MDSTDSAPGNNSNILSVLFLLSHVYSTLTMNSVCASAYILSLEDGGNIEKSRVLVGLGGSYALWGKAMEQYAKIEMHSFHPMSFFQNIDAVRRLEGHHMTITSHDEALYKMAEYIAEYNAACDEAFSALDTLLHSEEAREKIRKTNLCDVVADFKVN